MDLSVIQLTVGYYEDVYVLWDVSIEARRGRITSIIGPNGAGKTTLLKTVYGFLKPQRGKILLGGKDLAGLKPFQMLDESIAYVTQERGILMNMDVAENLELGAWRFRRDKARKARSIEEVYLRYPILKERRRVKAGNLSGGEQRLLEFGRVLMNEPKVILFDEPTAGLAPRVASAIYDEIGRLREEGRTIVLVEQNVKKAVAMSDYTYLLELGKVKCEGTREELNLREIIAPWVAQS